MEQRTTIFDIVEQGQKKNVKGLCFSTKVNGEWVHTSVKEFQEKVRHLSMGLHKLGIRKGDKVALHSENRTEWLIVDQAVLSLGAVLVPIYTTQPGDQIEYILNNSETKVYFVSNSDLFASFKPHQPKIESLKRCYAFEEVDDESVSPLQELLDEGKKYDAQNPDVFEACREAVDPDDLATLIYTSGTTGTPKGVMLTHDCVASNVLASQVAIPFDVEEARPKQMLSFLPLAHVFERMVTYLYQHFGLHTYYVGSIDELVQDFAEIKPVCFATVPRVLEKVHAGYRAKVEEMSGVQKVLANAALNFAETYDVNKGSSGIAGVLHGFFDKLVYPKLRAALGGEVKTIISGGAALSPMIMNFFNAIGILTGQGYGLTETSPVISVFRKDKLKAGSSGIAIPGVEVRIAEDGEILARGRNIMKGYYKMEEATKEVIDEDGFFHTGDIGHLDEEGFVFITDRKKALFKLSTGKYVGPQHIENLLVDHLCIEQVVVVGNGRKFCAALIIPDYKFAEKYCKQHHLAYSAEDRHHNENVIALVQEAVDDVNKKLPHWEQVKKFRLLEHPLSIETGELTPKMSIKRAVVTRKFANLIEEMYD